MSLEHDLERLAARHDDDRLAAWAVDITTPAARDLGHLADWSVDVTATEDVTS